VVPRVPLKIKHILLLANPSPPAASYKLFKFTVPLPPDTSIKTGARGTELFEGVGDCVKVVVVDGVTAGVLVCVGVLVGAGPICTTKLSGKGSGLVICKTRLFGNDISNISFP